MPQIFGIFWKEIQFCVSIKLFREVFDSFSEMRQIYMASKSNKVEEIAWKLMLDAVF